MAKLIQTEYEIQSARVRSPLKIALVTDLHERRAYDIVNCLRQVQPDLIAVAGDTFERYSENRYESTVKKKFNPVRWLAVNIAYYVNKALTLVFGRHNQPNTQNAYHFLRQASAIAPVFLSLGNHEQELKPEDYALFREYHIRLLDNEGEEFAVKNNLLYIGGLSTDYDEAWLYRFSKEDGFRLLLCHHPEYYDALVKDTTIDLTLAGHNHGGQVRLFGRGLAGAGGRIFPKYDKGKFDERLIVSAGCANTAAIPRVNNPRELVIVNLSPK